jgi:UDP-N-acetylmuramate dehydrogenase
VNEWEAFSIGLDLVASDQGDQMDDRIRELERSVKGKVLRSARLSDYTTYRTGGEAELLIEPSDENDLIAAIRYARSADLSLTILGAGSNVIAPDAGISGVVIVTRECLDSIDFLGGDIVRAGAGAMLDDLIDAAAGKGLQGLEELAGIPGTVGGAVVMNAGTRSAEISDHLRRVVVLSGMGRRMELDPAELGFGYRSSKLQGSGWLIVSADFSLLEGDPAALRKRAASIRDSRRERYPWDMPNAGSVFKHPPGHNAGRLIEEAGCKGMRSGGAAVSGLHANFIVNECGASSADIMDLISRVRARVLERFGISLELEQIPLPGAKE